MSLAEKPHALLHMLGVAFLEAAAWADGMTRDVEALKAQVQRLEQPAPQTDSLAEPTPAPEATPAAATPPGWKRRKAKPKVDVVSGAQFLADVHAGKYATPFPVDAIVTRREPKPGLEDMRYRVDEYADADMVYLEAVTDGKRALVGVDFLTSAFEVVA